MTEAPPRGAARPALRAAPSRLGGPFGGLHWTLGTLAALTLVVAVAARADWLQPDVSYREAQLVLRMATRDTAGHAGDAGRLDSLGVALLRLGRLPDAERVFRSVVAIRSDDPVACAALGKIALFSDRLAEADSLLAKAAADDGLAQADRFAALVRLGRYAEAAAMAGAIGQDGRAPLLEDMATAPIYTVTAGPARATVPFAVSYPIPLVRVKLNGQRVLMAVDTGANDLLIDASAARRYHVTKVSGQHTEFWSGTRVAVDNAMVQKLEIGPYRIERLPAGRLSLHKWSLQVNPQGESVAGVIGLNLLRRFTPTLDYDKLRLVLARDTAATAVADARAARIPFEMWGESELTVYGTLAQSRRMALVVQSGTPGCGVGAPAEVFDEIGVKPTMMSKLAKGAGQWLNGRPWVATVVPSVAIGSVAKDRVPGWLGALDSSELWRHGVRRDALISNDFFRGRVVTIAWGRRELLIAN